VGTTTNGTDRPSAAAPGPWTTGSVTSKDGTTIGYLQIGHGPGVVLLHGAMESARSHRQLALALADAHTVYLPDRRGRGLSGPYGQDYGVREDVDDVDALLTQTGAHDVFGVSSGALIWLQAALTLPAIHRAALHEPALFVGGAPKGFLERFDREMARGQVAAALVTAMKGARMGPPIFNVLPRWLLERLTAMAMAGEDQKAEKGAITMRMLAPTLHFDFELVVEMSERLETFRAVPAEVLLLGGSKSPAYLKAALDALATILPRVKRVELPGLDHGGSSDSSDLNRGGDPARVAQELHRFFA
jgi:pimeloyl-ACP methyl ester carboxylesterase